MQDPIVAYLEVEEGNLVQRFNDDFGDAVLMVVQSLSGLPDATSAAMTAIDPLGIDATVTDPSGEHSVRLDFAVDVKVPDHLPEALFELLARARSASGEDDQTSAEREAAAIAAIGTHLTEVVAVKDIHRSLRQITFGGGDLATTFEPNGPDCFFYVLLPPPGRDQLTIDRTFSWEKHAQTPVEDQAVGAYYTLRNWRPDAAEVDILVVLHGEGDHAGHASSWAATAEVGDAVALWGPRTAFHPPEGTDHLLLVADETGLPAVAGILDWLPDDWTATVVAEAASPEEDQELPVRDGVEVVRAYRDGRPAGTTSLLVDTTRQLPELPAHTYVYGGGESKAMTAVRRHVRDERGLARESVSLVAYWRHSSTRDVDFED